jgi:dopamine beta-monooxygenase
MRTSLLLLFLFLTNIINAFNESSFRGHFERKAQLGENILMLWTINQADQKIELGILAKTTGWVAVGLSESGSMRGADLAILQFDERGVNFDLGDYFSEDYAIPVREPDNFQDWKLTSSVYQNGTHVAFQFERNLLTCDDKDFVFDPKPKYVVYATGYSGTLSYHGSSLESRGSVEVRFFTNDGDNSNGGTLTLEEQLEHLETQDPSSQIYEFAMPNLTVPPASTSYFCLPLKLNTSGTVQSGAQYHITKWIGVPRSDLIHHMFVYRCPMHAIQTEYGVPYECDSKPPQCDPYIAWGLGQGMANLPSNVGIPLGDEKCSTPQVIAENGYSFTDPDCFAYFLVEFHYNNPSMIAGQADISGLKVLITTQLRKYDMGVFTIGPAFPLIQIPPSQQAIQFNTECPVSCTSRFPEGGVNVFASQLHMHILGRKIWIQHIRDGVELVEITRKDFYDFHKQSLSYIFPEKTLLPGDRIIASCVFDSSDKSEVTRGGWTSVDEMCVGFLGYYPRMKTISYCNIAYDSPEWAYCGPSSYSGRMNTSHEWDEQYRVPVTYGPGGGNGVTDRDYLPLEPGTHLRGTSVCELKAYEQINDPFKAWDEWAPLPMLAIAGCLAFCQVIHILLSRFSEKYQELPEKRTQRNVQIYILSLVVLTAGFIFSVVGCQETGILNVESVPVVASENSEMRKLFLKMALFGTTLIGIVYVFEMVYRLSMDIMLYIHHWITLGILTVLTFAMHETLSTFYVKLGVFLSFNATTEQPVFISLLMYRLAPESEKTRASLVATSLYTFVTKTTFFILVVNELAKFHSSLPGQQFEWQPAVKWQHTMFIVISILASLLYIVQLRCCKILYEMSKRTGVYYERINGNNLPASRRTSMMSEISSSDQNLMMELGSGWRTSEMIKTDGSRTPEMTSPEE